MKSLNFSLSLIFSAAVLILGASLASSLSASPAIDKSDVELAPNKAASSEDTSLLIQLSGVRSSKGKILVMVFDNAKAFRNYDYTQAAGYQEIDAMGKTLTLNFPSLKQGPYAVFVMHDENNDYQLNQVDGYPIEGFAISGAADIDDEPSFEQAAVFQGQHELELVYF